MSETLLVSVILALCLGDSNAYTIQDEKVDCHHYYVNCLVNKQGNWGTRELEWCTKNKK